MTNEGLDRRVAQEVFGMKLPTQKEMAAEAKEVWKRQPDCRHFMGLGGFSAYEPVDVNGGGMFMFRALVPSYSSDISEAWKLVERFGFMVHPCAAGRSGKPAAYWVGYPRDGHAGLVGDVNNPSIGYGVTAPKAICMAALEAVRALSLMFR
jgi:hypothetical protein